MNLKNIITINMNSFIYKIGIKFLEIYLNVASLVGNEKAKKAKIGRRFWKKDLSLIKKNKVTYWIHVASHGEAIMSLPIIEKIINKKDCQVAMSFFSSSGYENFNFQNNNFYKFYLPLDKKKNCIELIEFIRPQILIFIKYDLWLNLINECKKRGIPTLLVSGKFRKEQWYFKYYGAKARVILKSMSYILTIDHSSEKLLLNNNFKNIKYCGDTRYDQVTESKKNNISLIINNPCVILGSSWTKEEKYAAEIIEKTNDINWIIVPHEIQQHKLKKTKKLFGENSSLLSNIDLKKPIPKVLIIDEIGILSTLYNFSDIAFVGGGFSGKIHNILEAGIKGNIIIFGPKIEKYPEAKLLFNKNLAFKINNSKELKNTIENLLKDPKELKKKQNKIIQIIEKQKGATEKVWEEIEKIM